MLRGLVLLLLLANALFFAWARGWLGPAPHHAEREPERLAAQVRPEALKLLPPVAASAAVQAARAAAVACLEAGPFTETDLAVAEATLINARLPEGSWARADGGAGPQWLVYAGRYPDQPLRSSREEDLRKLKLAYELITAPPDLAPGFVLSRHPTREEAQAWLDARSTPALRGVRLVQLPGGAMRTRLRVARADIDTAERLKAMPADLLAGGFKPCQSRP